MASTHAAAIHVTAARMNEAAAMAELLALLGSGEDTAADAFGSLAHICPSAERELLAIVADEERHGRMVAGMRANLPSIAADAPFLRRQKRFFYGLAEGDLAARFAAIFAIDSALCLMLALLRRGDAPILAPYRNTFSDIHRDEARHAALTRTWSRKLGDPEHNVAVVRNTRLGLVELLQWRSEAFAAIGIEPEILFARLAEAPNA